MAIPSPGRAQGPGGNQSLAPRFSLAQPSPEAAAIMKYGNIPVDLYSGVPNIAIPLYTIQLKDFELPITLTYHAGGIKVDEIASNVGLGWTLNYGGMLTSQVHGLSDYEVNGGWLGAPTLPQTGVLRTFWTQFDAYETDPEYLFMKDAAEGVIDTQPDLFYFNLNGKTVRHFFSQSPGSAHTMPFGRFDITSNSIKDGDDVTYTFGQEERTTTNLSYSGYEEIGIGMRPSVQQSAYYISGIATPHGESIAYTYDNYDYSFTNQVSSTRYVHVTSGPTGCPIVPTTKSTNSTSLVNGKRVKTITTSAGVRLTFTYGHVRQDIASGAAAALTGIVVSNTNTGAVLKTITLAYDYYRSCGTTSTDPDCNRLKLVSVHVAGEMPYTFDYNTTALPKRLSFNQDHWGYFNNASNSVLFPTDVPRGFTSGANRNAHNTAVAAGVLLKITYPTGGTTEFQYERNPSSSGLRAARITDSPLVGVPVVRHYQYGPESQYYFPAYYYLFYKDKIEGSTITDCPYYAQSVSSFTPLGNGHAGGAAYSRVREYVDSDTKGYTDYRYSIDGGSGGVSWGYPYAPVVKSFWVEGLLLEKSAYRWDASASGWKPVSREVNTYKTAYGSAATGPNEFTLRGVAIAYRKLPMYGLAARGPEFDVSFYEMHSSWSYPTRKVETFFDPADSTKRKTVDHRYYYDNPNHIQLTRHVINNSLGDSLIVYNRYMQDVQPTWAHLSTPVAERRTIRKTGGTERLVEGEIVSYQNWPGIFPTSYRKLAITSPVAPSSVPLYTGGTPDSRYEQRESYTYNGKLLSSLKKDGITTTYVWGYGGEYVVAEVKNALPADVSGTGFSQSVLTNVTSTEAAKEAELAKIRNHASMKKAEVTTYTFKPSVGMSSKTDATGRRTSYEYDAYGRLVRVKDHFGNVLEDYRYNYRP
ncbi:RHS repeat domain-containing protein [Parapedobacter koreensis]|nr:RHS repeat domain-containing protein [Parapedobacter koreensis]